MTAGLPSAVSEPADTATAAAGGQPCPFCGHEPHLPGIECRTPIFHKPSGPHHMCLCLARSGATWACPPQMTCQGGAVGYVDLWKAQQRHDPAGRFEQLPIPVDLRSMLVALFSVAHTRAQADHAARSVLDQHAHQLAALLRTAAERDRTHGAGNLVDGLDEAADLIKPQEQP